MKLPVFPPEIRAEYFKLLSVRSTFVLNAAALLIVVALSFISGFRNAATLGPQAIQAAILESATVIEIFVSIIAILLITHEYRYNLINYSLTLSNSRFKVLSAKMVVIGIYAAALMVLTAFAVWSSTQLGAMTKGIPLVSQQIDLFDVTWRTLAYVIGGAWIGLLLGFLFRSIVVALACLLLVPTLIEGLLHLLLKVNANILPFGAHSQIVTTAPGENAIAPGVGLLIFAGYLLAGWIVATVLFIRRDAN